MTDESAPGMESAIRAAEWLGRVRFGHDDPAQWWRECLAACDAAAEAIIADAGEPAALIRRADDLLHELADLLARPCCPGLDVLGAICGHAPTAGKSIERVGREALPLLVGQGCSMLRHAK